MVEKAHQKRQILGDFFEKTLQISKGKAQMNACKIEHLLDDEIIEKLKKYV